MVRNGVASFRETRRGLAWLGAVWRGVACHSMVLCGVALSSVDGCGVSGNDLTCRYVAKRGIASQSHRMVTCCVARCDVVTRVVGQCYVRSFPTIVLLLFQHITWCSV